MTSRFGALLRRWRQRAGLSQDDLAERAGLGVRTVRGLETGQRGNPQVRTVRLLADALGLDGAERAELFTAAGHAEPADPDEDLPARVGPVGGPRRTPAPALGADPLVGATDALAYAVHARWRREEEQQQVHDPVPLPVRWRPAPDALRDSWANTRLAQPGRTARPLDLTGRLDQVVEVYRRVPSSRLIVLGRAGAGKTILTTRFVLDLLAARAPADPVPVIFGLGSWNPVRAELRDWLAEQLVRDHPGLAAPGPGGSTLAAALVDAHRVLPVLDGFDEVAGGLHRAALAALNATTLPLLLTSRVDEYRAAVRATGVLRAAGAVELVDLDAADVADYLPRTTGQRATGPSGTVWQPVLDHVRDHPDSPLAAVLTTPLMVALARRIYSDTPGHDPAELVDADRFGDRDAIERHLLGGFVPAAYQERRGGRAHDADQVRRWLGHLADHLTRLGTHDLAWWQLGTSMSRRARTLVVALVVFAGVWLGDVVVEGSLLPGVAPAELVGLGAVVALLAGVSFGLVHGHLARVQPLEPVRFRLRLRARSRVAWRRVRVRARMGLLFGALVGCSYGLVMILMKWLISDLPVTPAMVFVDAGVFTAVFASGAALAFGLIAAGESPQDIRSAASPAGLLESNRKTVLLQLALFGPLFAVFFSAMTWLIATALMSLPGGGPFGVVIAWPGSAGLLLGLVGGFGGGFGYLISMTAWGQWVVFARFWLPLTGRLPWAVHAFLDDAYRRGVLRRAGAVYQFRHARLQDHLAEAHRDRS
ncbi:helix-turn-helix domain-containing protein [Saccharothrix texasensis]|uniref:NACHT domain-containing protein n=1 Tax=Saccharothrix texasensis TaxID=103734 RepID=A0A3N1GY15_9PSEU|nr:helix-turn-helix domain-containing protein [Saccharothrix texasensis]ROP35164.1 NACHT domain-containing protein [Saccharothrix texasensis]